MRSLYPLFPLLLFAACKSEPPEDELIGTRWAFATQNPYEEKGYNELMQLGDIVTVGRDSLYFESLRQPDLVGIPRYDSLRGGDTLPNAVILSRPDPLILNVDLFQNGVLKRNRYFSPVDTSKRKLDPLELAGRTYRYAPAGEESTLVYFGDSKMPDNKLLPGPYFMPVPSEWFSPQSLVMRSAAFDPTGNREFTPRPLSGLYHGILSRGDYRFEYERLYRDGSGNAVVESYDQKDQQYLIQQDLLDPVEGKIPPMMTDSELADRLTGGIVTVDMTYPDIDSASTKYTNGLNNGVEKISRPEDLEQLAFSFNPDGEFICMAGEKVSRIGRWMRSDDGSFLIIDPANPIWSIHIPILEFTDERIALRYPISVFTREPKGVKLPSYGSINAYIEILAQ